MAALAWWQKWNWCGASVPRLSLPLVALPGTQNIQNLEPYKPFVIHTSKHDLHHFLELRNPMC